MDTLKKINGTKTVPFRYHLTVCKTVPFWAVIWCSLWRNIMFTNSAIIHHYLSLGINRPVRPLHSKVGSKIMQQDIIRKQCSLRDMSSLEYRRIGAANAITWWKSCKCKSAENLNTVLLTHSMFGLRHPLLLIALSSLHSCQKKDVYKIFSYLVYLSTSCGKYDAYSILLEAF